MDTKIQKVWFRDQEIETEIEYPLFEAKVKSGAAVALQQKNKQAPQSIRQMAENYRGIVSSQSIPGYPLVAYDQTRLMLVHVYQNVSIDTSNFQREVTSFLSRKESLSKNVATVYRIKDQHISYTLGVAQLKVSIVTDYVPWRYSLHDQQITYEEALFLLNGSLRGFRELLHRTRTPFVIKDNMIGIDGAGEVKVWWNQYFYKSNFAFALMGEDKLQDMLKSLISVILSKMQSDEADKLEKLLIQGQLTFFGLLQKVKQISKGLNLQIFGLNLVKQVKEYPLVMQQKSDLISSKVGSSIYDQLRLSKLTNSPQKLILTPSSPKKKFQFGKDKSKLITKRVFQNGNTPANDQKLQMIKLDIEQLRQSTARKTQETNIDQKMRTSNSIGSIYSFKKGLIGDTNIPEVNQLIKEEEVIGPKEQLTVSRFVDPVPKNNPQICGVCNQLNLLRRTQSFVQSGEASSPLMLRLNSLGNGKPEVATPRSVQEINKKLMTPKTRFGESQARQSQNKLFFSAVRNI